ncbi:hypothetical protein PHYPSEUDO_010049 [Phytophthora pseudosyringae]|uniref:Uncharacterized protein n=1 Tax=Phytophthora pseudosyringae TaxID=221518 RepID=A0A8T1W6Q8_9STRA|nr:hypothetical protein PHYPSEUDO_010049 [Phytophthora pseudosyringae]
MVDEEFTLMYQHLGNLREVCKRRGVALPENIYDASTEISTALSLSDGNEEEALKLLTEKFKRGTKREHSALVLTTGAKRSPGTEFAHIFGNDDVEKETPMDLGGEDDEEGEEPPQKLSRLAEDVRNKPAAVASN